MNILGIWDGHDSGAAVLRDGTLRFAVNEERLSRRKLEVAFPVRSIEACLHGAALERADVHLVAVSTSDPAKTLARIWPGSKERYYAVRRRKAPPGPFSRAIRFSKYHFTELRPGRVSRALSRWMLRRQLSHGGFGHAGLTLVDHHEAHAAAAAWASGFSSCAVLTVDGLGDGASSTIWRFDDGSLKRVASSPARHSLGVFFEHVTNLLNMRELEDEGKVMALADYAAPIPDTENPLLQWMEVRNGVIEAKWPGHALRRPLARIQWRFANEQFAFLAQRTVEKVLVALARDALRLTGTTRLALAGGVVSNVKATRHVRLIPEVDELYVFPHMGDGGLAVGAAAAVAARAGESPRLDLHRLDLGPSFTHAEIESSLRRGGLTSRCENLVLARAINDLAQGRVLMWFQGRMEYGPRALGHRSVLARPDRPELRDRLNLALKRRVWYQPFCPSILASEAPRLLVDWAGGRNTSMTMAYRVADDSLAFLRGVVSVDGTCRPQIVPDAAGGPFTELLHEARRAWGVGAVLNTSFNIHGEPLVCSPDDAVDVFLRSGADALAIGPFLVRRPA